MNEETIIRRVSAVGVGGNILLSAIKLWAGVVGRSAALVSDAVHSLSDVLASLTAWLGVRLGRRPADEGHPYGHERFECLASLALGLLLTLTALGIGLGGVKTLLTGGSSASPGTAALWGAAVSIAVKEAMFRYVRHYAGVLGSSAFLADAWHHRSDALSSVGSLLGAAGAMAGYPALDSAACVVICLFILRLARDVLRDALSRLLDSSCGAEKEQELSDFIEAQEGVIALDLLRSRRFGDRLYLDAEIAVDAEQSLAEAHCVAEAVHDAVERRFPEVKHIMIHENPAAGTVGSRAFPP
ncbi:MAG: cation transporter [Clostridiales bacterium]|nr:cation transporter [Candidatus Apopatocola equi]